ncbi:hypothetical protein NL676_030326 [Syzygium grande]|nr:hypothetical protein NL676_030326 [Syzygium grande]
MEGSVPSIFALVLLPKSVATRSLAGVALLLTVAGGGGYSTGCGHWLKEEGSSSLVYCINGFLLQGSC